MVTQFVKSYLASPGRLMILEDHDASPTAPFLREESVTDSWAACGEFLYWFSTNPQTVESVLHWGIGLFSCMALSRLPSHWNPEVQKQVSGTDLSEIAAVAEHIVVDAFDFEGFIAWSRPKPVSAMA